MISQFVVSEGEGYMRLTAGVSVSAGGICIYLCGGTGPHIGSTVMAEPRASLTGQGISCTSSVINMCGHKDEVFARKLAESVCVISGLPTCRRRSSSSPAMC